MSTVSRDHDCESWARAPLPIHIQFRLQDVPQANGDETNIATTVHTAKMKIQQKNKYWGCLASPKSDNLTSRQAYPLLHCDSARAR